MTLKKPRGRAGGRKPIPLAERKPSTKSGKISVRIDPAREMVIPVDVETRMLAVRLMLHDWPGVERVEDLFAYALRQMAKTTDDIS